LSSWDAELAIARHAATTPLRSGSRGDIDSVPRPDPARDLLCNLRERPRGYMSKKKSKTDRPVDSERSESGAPELSELEVELSLICLKYFRGDWDMYLDYLQGPRVTDGQRRRELPLVERLRDRDRRTDYLTYFLEDEVVAVVQKLAFSELHRVWEECLVLYPDADPFGDEARAEDDARGQADSARDVPPTLH
jgi:hypothetical protein